VMIRICSSRLLGWWLK